MMRTLFLSLLMISTLFSPSARAALHSLGAYKIGFSDEQGFTPVEGLWGVGFSLLSEPDSSTGLRTSLGVFDTELQNFHFNHEELKADTGNYYDGRKKWLGGLEGSKWLKGLPYERIQNPKNKVDGYRIGFEYELGGTSQIQYSYFLVCDHRMFHLKALIPESSRETEDRKLGKIVSSFQCQADPSKVGRFDSDEIRKNWKAANQTADTRALALQALREFYMEYEDAHKEAESPAGGDRIDASAVLKKIDALLSPEAAWASNETCFFAGFPSSWHTVGGKTKCAQPEASKACGEGQIKCNPALFGEVCILEEFRQNATMTCNSEYSREKPKHDAEIAKLLLPDPKALLELEQNADDVCASEPYRSSNYGLCSTLYQRVGAIANDPETAKKMAAVPPKGADPENYQSAYDTTQSMLQILENYCMTEDKKGLLSAVEVNGKTIDCVKLKETTMANLQSLDRQDEGTNFQDVSNRTCVDCMVGEDGKGVLDQATMAALNGVKEAPVNSCSAAEKAAQSHCGADILCSAAASAIPVPLIGVKVGTCDLGRDSCLTHAATGVVEALWGAVKGIWDLGKGLVKGVVSDAWRGTKNLTKGVLNWFGASYKIDDASSYKVVQLANTGGGMLKSFLKNPGKAVSEFFQAIWAGINQWMMEDVFCAQWSGVPHLSKCLKPASSWECLSCKQKLNGTCTAIGYIASELVASFFTGGAAGAAEASGMTAKVVSGLGKIAKTGKLKYADFAAKFPKIAKVAEVTGKATKITGKVTWETAKFAGKVVMFPLKVLKGTAKGIFRMLEKIPVVNLPIKAVKLVGKQAENFGKFYANLSRKAFAQGQDLGRTLGGRATRSSLSLAGKELAIVNGQRTGKVIADSDAFAPLAGADEVAQYQSELKTLTAKRDALLKSSPGKKETLKKLEEQIQYREGRIKASGVEVPTPSAPKPELKALPTPKGASLPGADLRSNARNIEGRLMVRDPASQDWNHPAFKSMQAGAQESVKHFDQFVWDEKSMAMSKTEFRKAYSSALDENHVLANYESKPGQFHAEYPGVRRDDARFMEFPSSRRPNAAVYREKLDAELGIGKMPEGGLPIRGIKQADWPKNGAGGTHRYPPGTSMQAYSDVAADHLYSIRKLIADGKMTEAQTEIGQYYHVMVNARPYDQINNSLFANQTNYLLKLTGHPGVEQGHLDHVLMRMSSEQVDQFWPKVLKGEVKNANAYGIDL